MGNYSRLPLLVLAGAVGLRLVCNAVFVLGVLWQGYFQDARYAEWRS
jgi:hypothetical protein